MSKQALDCLTPVAIRCFAPIISAVAFLLAPPAVVSAGNGEIVGDGEPKEMTFSVNFRYPPTEDLIRDAKKALTKMSQIICDATDGQIVVKEVRLTSGPAEERLAAFWYFPRCFRSFCSGLALDGSTFTTQGRHCDISILGQLDGRTLAHEMGHHAFGLGEQYDEQRRYGTWCGIGPGFDAPNEENNSIMGSGRLACSGPGFGAACTEFQYCEEYLGFQPCFGPNDGDSCLFDDHCASGNCEPERVSEFSVSDNHDPITGDDVLCPPAAGTARIEFSGFLDREVDLEPPYPVFDPSDIASAEATSLADVKVEVIAVTDSLAGSFSPELRFFFSHTGSTPGPPCDRETYRIFAFMDEGFVGGTAGNYELLDSWDLAFNVACTPPLDEVIDPELNITGLVNGADDADDLEITLDFEGLTVLPLPYGSAIDAIATGGRGACPFEFYYPNYSPGCAGAWNTTNDRWETSDQSLRHDSKSDWETIVENYSSLDLDIPNPRPQANPPTECASAPLFEEAVEGTDRVLLLMDNSVSMLLSARDWDGEWEVCGNNIDDDDDGETDEDDCEPTPVVEVCDNLLDDDLDGLTDENACAEARVDFVKVAARAYADLAKDAGIELGLASFNEEQYLLSDILTLDAGSLPAFKTNVDELSPSGLTAIGSALEWVKDEFADGRSKTVLLMTDDVNTVGSYNEVELKDMLRDENIIVFTIPATRTASSNGFITNLADRTGGKTIAAGSLDELPAVYAELAAERGGGGLVLARTPFALFREGGKAQQPPDARAPVERRFVLPVEEGADALVAFISGRNGNMETWGLGVELLSPKGERYDRSSPEFSDDPFYLFFRITDPTPGNWILRAIASNPGLQESTALAFVENPRTRLLADVRPRTVPSGGSVRITADPIYVVGLEGGTKLTATIRKPDGATASVDLSRPFPGAGWGADFSDTALRGAYEVTIRLRVDEEAQPFRGESIFDGPERYPIDVKPFSRVTSLTFSVPDGDFPECKTKDCDRDGIPDQDECGEDTDRDGIPNFRDIDSDNDEKPDSVEGLADVDGNGVPDACDPQRPPRKPKRSPQVRLAIDEEEQVIILVCSDRGRVAAKLLRTSIRRIELRAAEFDRSRRWPRWLEWILRFIGRGDPAAASFDVAKRVLKNKWEAYRLLLRGRLDCKTARKLIGDAITMEKELTAL